MPTANFNGKCVSKVHLDDGDIRVEFEPEDTGTLKSISSPIRMNVSVATADLLVLGDNYVFGITTP